jgi:hypothetical protein
MFRRISAFSVVQRRWDHHGRTRHGFVVPDFDAQAFDLVVVPDGMPVLEELEVEAVIAEFLIDDPSKRLLVPEVKVAVLPAPPPVEIAEPELQKPDADVPSFAKRMIRMHPKLLDSGDDSSDSIA